MNNHTNADAALARLTESDVQKLLDLAVLETKCPTCKGGGGDFIEGGVFWPCGTCEGAKYVPTKLGQKILDLVRHASRRQEANQHV